MEKALLYARELMEKGEDFVVARILDSMGSAPRGKGAWMLMDRRGRFVGTVGGGVLEAETEKLCRAVLESGEDQAVNFSLSEQESGSLDMRCGGEVSMRISYMTPEKAKKFLSGFEPPKKVFIFGGGHIALALEALLRTVSFQTVVIDDREDFANAQRFPHAEVHVTASYARAFDGLTTDADSYIVIVTRGHAGDYEVLRSALRLPHAYIGMIGSRKKVADAMERLKNEGFSEAERSSVHSPIGLKIGAETPEEIAVSVAAEMIAVRAEQRK